VLSGSVRVRNVGRFPGAEVVQVYLSAGTACDLTGTGTGIDIGTGTGTGGRDGYLRSIAMASGVPVKQLKAFNRTEILDPVLGHSDSSSNSGSAKNEVVVGFQLSSRDFSSWDEKSRAWILACLTETAASSQHPISPRSSPLPSPSHPPSPPISQSDSTSGCCFQVFVGASSRDIRLQSTVKVA
jgi:hypothetical protein